MYDINSKYSTMIDWASSYRRMGWNVVPLFNFTKIPGNVDLWNDEFGWIPGWKDLQTRQATDKEFNHWFVEQGPTGLGIITGKISNIFVVDEDSYKSDGMKFEFESKMRTRTARGGSHHFFKYVEGTKTSGFRKGVNIEIKSDGGFIVLPPSQVAVDEAKDDIRKYLWESACKLEDLPTISEEQLAKYRMGGSSNVPEDLSDLMNVKSGGQHNSLRTLALVTLNKFAQRDWQMATDLIIAASQKYDPPVQEHKAMSVIKDVMNFIVKNPKDTVDREIVKETLQPRSLKEVYKERKEEKKLELVAPQTGYKELDALIKGWIPGHLYTLTGNTNVGKTAIASNFSERVRKQGQKVLYFALEPENTIIDYLASVRTNKEFDQLTDNDIKFDDGLIHIYGKQEVPDLTTMLHIVETTEENYGLIVIDHVGYFIHDKANYLQDQSNTIKKIVGLAKQKRVAIMIIAHLRKAPQGQRKDYVPSADDISGSGAFKQDSTEVMIVIRPIDENDENGIKLSRYGQLHVVKTKSGMNGAVPLLFGERKANILSLSEIMDPGDKYTAMGFPNKTPKLTPKDQKLIDS